MVNVLALSAVGSVATPAVAQHVDSRERPAQVAGAVTLTNKGISLLPALTLGKPAAIFDVAIRTGDLSFEPQFRLGLDGKPWSFIFWWRYRLLRGEKLSLAFGAHPAVLFRTITVSTDGMVRDAIVATRYLAGEVSASYSVTQNLSVGAYSLYSQGVEADAVKHTQFLAWRANLRNVRISDRLLLQFAPQCYYLSMDGREGVYLNAGLTVATRTLPLSISAMVNRAVWTRIAAGEHFLWNVSFSYYLK